MLFYYLQGKYILQPEAIKFQIARKCRGTKFIYNRYTWTIVADYVINSRQFIKSIQTNVVLCTNIGIHFTVTFIIEILEE